MIFNNGVVESVIKRCHVMDIVVTVSQYRRSCFVVVLTFCHILPACKINLVGFAFNIDDEDYVGDHNS